MTCHVAATSRPGSRSAKFSWTALALLACGISAAPVQAQPPDAEGAETPESNSSQTAETDHTASGSIDLSLSASTGDETNDPEAGTDGGAVPDDSGAFLAAGKVGGIASFNGLDPFVQAGVELGWVFAGMDRQIAAMLQVEYAVPPASGNVAESGFDPERVPDGGYKWELVQKELVFQPTFMYRLTGISDLITPYAGIGARLYLLETVVKGSAGGQPFGETSERSTKFGVGVPLGAEFALGPGGIFAEFLFQWGPFDHKTTGDTHLGGGTLFLGYRALL